MEAFCKDHSNHEERIKRLEKENSSQWDRIDNIDTKLNLIIGGVILSPVVITIVTFLLKS